jgi:glucosamine--fructose-6-phosphate aminotransferase (isomerizing)
LHAEKKSHGGSIKLCGIFGTTLHKGKAAPVIHQALERLEYRGYDSVGLATIHDNELSIKKDHGSIREVDSRLNFDEMYGKIGVGHTRWATHSTQWNNREFSRTQK